MEGSIVTLRFSRDPPLLDGTCYSTREDFVMERETPEVPREGIHVTEQVEVGELSTDRPIDLPLHPASRVIGVSSQKGTS